VWVPKSSVVGARLTWGVGTGTPLPLRGSVAGPLLASEAMGSGALRSPSEVAPKATVSVHWPLMGSGVVVLQSPARVYSVAAAPLMVKALKVSGRLPLLTTVTLCDEVVPSWVSAKVSDVALNWMRPCGAGVAVPSSVTVWGLPTAV